VLSGENPIALKMEIVKSPKCHYYQCELAFLNSPHPTPSFEAVALTFANPILI